MIPLLAGISPEDLRGPLSGLNALVCSSEEQLHQALVEIGAYLELSVQSPAAYLKQLRSVMEEVSLTVVGTPPSPQMLRVQSNRTVKAIRLDYLLSTGPCIASDKLSLEGESFDVPIEDHQVIKLWNTPRADKNWSDYSGPAKLRLMLLVNGNETPYVSRSDGFLPLREYRFQKIGWSGDVLDKCGPAALTGWPGPPSLSNFHEV